MKAAVVYKHDSVKIAEEAKKFIEESICPAEIFHMPDKRLEGYDFIVSVGGDGTILRILQEVVKCPPIFGINTGRIGLLTHTTPENFRDVLPGIIERWETEEFMRIEAEINGKVMLRALNEIAFLSSTPARLVGLRVVVDGVEVEDMRCDGMLFATPIGSTAYALSSGGPIIDPYLQSILIVPVAPFRLGWKPWVIKHDRRIEIEVSRERNALAISDGQKILEVGSEDRIALYVSQFPAVFFRSGFNRLERIRGKLTSLR